jgi:hypothetical protein
MGLAMRAATPPPSPPLCPCPAAGECSAPVGVPRRDGSCMPKIKDSNCDMPSDGSSCCTDIVVRVQPLIRHGSTVLTCLVVLCMATLNRDASPSDGPAPVENELALASPELPSVNDPGREPVLFRVVPARRTSWCSAAVLSGPSMSGAEGRSRSCSAGGRCAGCRGPQGRWRVPHV